MPGLGIYPNDLNTSCHRDKIPIPQCYSTTAHNCLNLYSIKASMIRQMDEGNVAYNIQLLKKNEILSLATKWIQLRTSC